MVEPDQYLSAATQKGLQTLADFTSHPESDIEFAPSPFRTLFDSSRHRDSIEDPAAGVKCNGCQVTPCAIGAGPIMYEW
jgi:hypothetical protein